MISLDPVVVACVNDTLQVLVKKISASTDIIIEPNVDHIPNFEVLVNDLYEKIVAGEILKKELENVYDANVLWNGQ